MENTFHKCEKNSLNHQTKKLDIFPHYIRTHMCTFERDEYCVNIIVLFSYKKNNELMCNYMLWMVQMLHTVYRAEGSASECLLGKLVF